MKVTITRTLAVAGTVLGLVSSSNAKLLDKVSVEAGADVMSRYVWRGQLITDDPVIQPSLTLGFGPVSLNVWGSIDATDINESDVDDDWRMQEVDYTASGAFSPMAGLDLEGAVIYYTFAGADGTSEVYGSLSLSALPLTPTLTVYRDFDELQALYASLGVSHSFVLTEKLSLDLGASIAWADEDYHEGYIGIAQDGFSDISVSVGLSYAVNDNTSLFLSLAFADFVDGDISDGADSTYGDSDIFFGGVGLAFSF